MPSLIIKCKTQNVKGETQNWAQCAEGGLSLEGFVFHSLAFFMSRTLRTRVPALGDYTGITCEASGTAGAQVLPLGDFNITGLGFWPMVEIFVKGSR